MSDKPTIREFTSEAAQSPDTERVKVDDERIQVINEQDLPDSSLPKEGTEAQEASSDGCPCVIHRDEQKSSDSPVVVQVDPDEDELVKYTYVDDPREVPEGVSLEEGPRGGLRFEETHAEFIQGQLDRSRERLAEQDYTQEQVEEAIDRIQDHHEIQEDAFSQVYDIVEGADANITEAFHRVKGVGSSLEKVHERDNQYDEIDELTDMHGSTFVVDDFDDAQEIFETMQGRDDIEIEKTVNHAEDRSNGYRAYHVVIEVEDGLFSEVQIKEKRMKQVASASHSLVLKPDPEAPVDEMDTLDDYPDEELQDTINDCLIDQADLNQGLIEESEVDCDPEAFEIIQEYMQLKGYI